MFGFFPQKLTTMTNHYLDWSRVGSLLSSENHRYTKNEILTRGAIITVTAASAFLGNYFNNAEKTNCSDTSASILCGMIGFLLSHSVVIVPLIKKRCEISSKCKALKNEITDQLSLIENIPFKPLIEQVVNCILRQSLSDEKHARASQTWGRRLALLTEVKGSFLLSRDEFSKFWGRDVSTIMDELSNPRTNQHNRLR